MIVLIVLVVPMLVASIIWLLLRVKSMARIWMSLLIGPLPVVAIAAAIAREEYSPNDPDPVVALAMVSLMGVAASAIAIGLLEWCMSDASG